MIIDRLPIVIIIITIIIKIIITITITIKIIIIIIYPRPGNWCPAGDNLISWVEGSSLALVDNPWRDGVSIKILV